MKKIVSIAILATLMSTLAFGGIFDLFKGKKNKELIIYTNSGSDGRAEWLTEKAEKAGFKINIVFGDGGDIKNRLLAEKNNPVADIVYGLNAMSFARFKNQNMLEPYKPNWVNEIDPNMADSDGYYHGIVKQAIALVYNPSVYNSNEAPKDWPDLWTNPKYKGKYNILGLGGGTSRTVLAGIAMRYLDPNGELGISKEGWENIKQYIQNGHHSVSGEDFTDNLIKEKVPMSMIWGSGISDKEKSFNFKFGIMNPSIGVPFVVEQVGIVKGTKKLKTAEKFVDWFGSAEIQGAWAQKFGSSPINKIAMENALDSVKELDKKLSKSQYINWEIVQKNIDQWVEKIELEYIN